MLPCILYQCRGLLLTPTTSAMCRQTQNHEALRFWILSVIFLTCHHPTSWTCWYVVLLIAVHSTIKATLLQKLFMLNKDLAVELCKAILTSKYLPLGQMSITVLSFPYLLTWCQVQSPFCFSFEQLDLKVFSNFISIYWIRLGENTFFRVKSKWNLNHPKKLMFNVDISPKDSDPREWMRDEDRSHCV